MKRGFLLFAAALLCRPISVAAQTLSYSNLVSRLTDLEHVATLPAPGDQCVLWSSHDRGSYYDTNSGQYVNWSANGDGGGIIRMEGTNAVLAEMQGPGCIWRTWSATPSSGHVRIYLDGTNGPPAVDLPFTGYFDKSTSPFTRSALIHTTAANGWNNYTPIPYQTSCKIVAAPGWGNYYQFTYETFPSNTQVTTFNLQTAPADSAALDYANAILSNCGSDPAGTRPGQVTLTNVVTVNGGSTQLVAQLTGPAAITGIRVKLSLPSSPDDYNLLRQLALQINWDGEAQPSVWAPLGDFFGTAPGANQYSSLPLGFTSDGWWYCYWYMPFGTAAQVRLVNDGTNQQPVTFQLTTAPLSKPLGQLARFHAKWHRDAFLPTEPGRSIDWTIATTTGTGRFVGTMLHIWNPGGGWWGEGDDKFFIDGEKFPSSFGTGSEDYFGYAWSSPILFQHALHNQTHNDGDSKGHVSVNRWHIADAVPFQQSFQGCIEKYYSNTRPTLYAAMAYWYLAAGGQDPYLPVALTNRIGYWTTSVTFKIPGAIEGENLTVLGKSGGTTQAQDMSGFTGQWSNDAQLWWTGGQPGDTLDLALPVAAAGNYALSLQMTEARDYAIVQLDLDGQALGQPIDLYNPSVVPTGALGLGSYQLSAGQHTLRAQIVGANTNAVLSYMFGLDYVLLTNATPPAARLAIADNAIGTGPATLDVWFAAPVTLPTAATVSNYSLNLPGLSITNAALRTNLPMGVVLGVSGPVTGDARLSVSGVQGPGGISVSNQIPVLARLSPALNVIANQYQQGRAAALSRSTDGIVQHDANVTTWTTFSGATGLSDFVGLTYAEPQVFSALKVDLGYQFVDGGDWGSLPRVYVLTHPLDTNQRAPENDPANWTAVTPSLISGNTFGSSPDAPTGTPPPNSPLVFDLSALPYSQRTGYGWAVGGVAGNGPTAQFVSIAELRAYGVSAAAFTNLDAAPQILLDLAPPSLTLPVGLPLTWSVIAAGTQPISYQWQFKGTNMNDDSRISGSHSNVLTIARVLASDSGSFELIMTNAVGSNASASANLLVTRVALNNGGGWTPNDGATITSNVLTLTDGAGSEARSSFLNLPQYVGAFTASFTYQDVGGSGADGAAFVLQQDSRGASALGGAGGGLGYSGISPSAAIEFNIYANNGVGIQLRTNGLTGAPYVTTAPVNLASGDPIGVTLRYDGAILALVLTDAVAAVSFSTNWSVALPAILGSNSAYVGFTGADGGVASTESISNFSFISLPKLSSQLASTGTILFSWPASAGGFGLQQNSSLNPTTWVKSPGPPELVGSQNQVLVTPAIGSKYYRLMLP